MRIENNFKGFLDEIERNYGSDSDNLDILELKLFSPKELLESGFIQKNTEGFFNKLKPLEKVEINKYFEQHVHHLKPEAVDVFNFNFGGETIGEFVINLKLQFIKSYLSRRLFEFIKSLKEPVF